ncbi:S1/P1 nuclease-domain-containing protein, partial [Chytriomyces sp. MP71]
AATTVTAWSGPEHQAIGSIASAFLAPETQAALNQLLTTFTVDGGSSKSKTFTFNGTVALMTTWADAVKNKGSIAYASTGGYHYIDYEDVTALDVKNKSATTTSCSTAINEVSCPEGVCITAAIANYTNRADVSNKFGDFARGEAILFLTHYLGDITQPLHNCGKLAGGNGYLVKWNGSLYEPPPYSSSKHNLHFIWDQFMIEADIQDNYSNSFPAYIKSIVNDITCGAYKDEAATWTQCKSPLQTDSGLVVKSVCPIEWSQEGNGFNCGSVWENTGSVDVNAQTDDLYTNGYHAKNKEVARKQLAKAGLRLAWALNTLAPASPKVAQIACTASTSAAVSSSPVPVVTSQAAATSTAAASYVASPAPASYGASSVPAVTNLYSAAAPVVASMAVAFAALAMF